MTAGVETHRFEDDGSIPNSPLPLLVYRGVLDLGGDPADACERRFAANGWAGGWRNGIYGHHHYHAETHEVLGIVAGDARVRFGGERGTTVAVRAGDVVVVPAGVGHRNEGASPGLLVVGAYPGGREPDIRTGKPDERRRALAAIPRVPIPDADPVFGRSGPLLSHWR